MNGRQDRQSRRTPGEARPAGTTHRIFFAAACLQAVLSIGVWIFARPGGVGADWHAHELVFGYAAAVIAGFLFTKTERSTWLPVLLVWAAARLAWLFVPDAAEWNAVLTVASTAAIGWVAGRSFLRGVKRSQNVIFPIVLAAIVTCDAAAQLQVLGMAAVVSRPAVLLGVFTVVILIVIMGGRIAGAAFSGLVQRAGGARIAPRLRLEQSMPVLIGAAALSLAADAPPLALAGFSWMAAGALLIRAWGWLPALRLAGPDLLALAAAQLFIAFGLAGIGAGAFHPPWSHVSPLHLVAIGGIGMSTTTMMLKSMAQRERLPLPSRTIAAVALLMGVAAIFRAGADVLPEIALAVAALAWCAAMLCCLWRLLAR